MVSGEANSAGCVCPASGARSNTSRRRSRPRTTGVSGTGVGCVCAAAAAGGSLDDENVPRNKNHQRPKSSNTNDEAVEDDAVGKIEQDGGAVLNLAGALDGLLHTSAVASANSADAADPLFHSSSTLVVPSALGSDSRARSIEGVHRMFHHDDTIAHDDEVRAGAFDSLVWRLGFSVGLLASESVTVSEEGDDTSSHEGWSELSQIVSTLSQVCRCSHSYRLATFNSAGHGQLFPLLFHIMRLGHVLLNASTSTSRGTSKNVSNAMIAVLGIMRSYCKVADIRPRMLKPPIANQLLPCLAELLRLCARNSHINRATRFNIEMDTLGLLKHMSHRCSESEARLLVVEKPALLELALMGGAQLGTKNSNQRAGRRRRENEYLATILWNCASHRSVRAAMLLLLEKEKECGANVSSVLCFLSSILSFNNDRQSDADDDDDDDDFELQKAALSCLGNLARGAQDGVESTADERLLKYERKDTCVSTILSHDSGIFVERLIAIAVDAPASSSLVCRRRAVRTIRCLVEASNSVNHAVDGNGNNCHPAVLGIASQRGLGLLAQLSEIMKNDEDDAVQIHAAESVATLHLMLTSSVDFEEDQTIEMLNSSFISVITSTTKNTKRTEIACRSLCLSSAPVVIDLHKQPDFFPSLLWLLCMQNYDPTASRGDETHTVRLSSLKLMRLISRFEANRPIMLRVSEEGRLPGDQCPICLLRSLAVILKPSGIGDDGGIGAIARAELQKEAAGILVELARDDSARSVVEYPDLLSRFTHYCTNTVGANDPERDEAKKALMRLVAKL